MTRSILNDSLLLKGEPLQSLVDYFTQINLTTFSPIIESGKNDQEKRQTILFILCAYSEDSPMVILRQSGQEEKENICEYLEIPEYMRHALISLDDPIVRQCATDYLYKFTGEMFRNLMFMKIQSEYLEMVVTNRAFATNEEGVIHYDFKEHGKAIAEKEKLARSIIKIENEMKTHFNRAEAIEAMKLWKVKLKSEKKSLGRDVFAESSPQIKS